MGMRSGTLTASDTKEGLLEQARGLRRAASQTRSDARIASAHGFGRIVTLAFDAADDADQQAAELERRAAEMCDVLQDQTGC
jgi:hypothetical protein